MLIYLRTLGLDHMANSDRQSSVSSSRAGGRFMPPVTVTSTSAPAAAILVTHAGMRGAALDRHDETADALARGHDLVAVAARLHDQAVFVSPGGGLDALI